MRLLREQPTYRESQTWSVHVRHLILELYRYCSKGRVLTTAAAGTRSLKALQLAGVPFASIETQLLRRNTKLRHCVSRRTRRGRAGAGLTPPRQAPWCGRAIAVARPALPPPASFATRIHARSKSLADLANKSNRLVRGQASGRLKHRQLRRT